ncbi:unnamed protein product [Urochloa humidicola]
MRQWPSYNLAKKDAATAATNRRRRQVARRPVVTGPLPHAGFRPPQLSVSCVRLLGVAPFASAAAAASTIRRGPDALPCLAYLLSGACGDGRRLIRLRLTVYHLCR